ncbi:MAG: helix-turn-helix domain-containing protein [Azoarcus sp.]|jgi:transcriptional regulator with XRE-family HTH domain|nr:helix-turn-helix domain-containing protein [Azoarcus sp.]
MKISHYMDEAEQRGIIKNDAEIARRLGVADATVSRWRTGQRAPDEDQAAALAELLNKPQIMAESAASRAKTKEGRAAWERLARSLSLQASLYAAIICTAILGSLTPTPTNAKEYAFGGHGFCDFGRYCALRAE